MEVTPLAATSARASSIPFLRPSFDGGGEALLHFGDGRRAVEANRERVLSSAAEMDVRVVEAGHDEVAA